MATDSAVSAVSTLHRFAAESRPVSNRAMPPRPLARAAPHQLTLGAPHRHEIRRRHCGRKLSHIAVEEGTVDWETCGSDGCIGVAAGSDGRCLVHTAPEERRRLLARLRDGAALDFVRGVPITQALLRELLEASRDAGGAVRLRSANFGRAIFADDTSFGAVGARFEDRVSFTETIFDGAADFLEATFAGPADFTKVRFKGDAAFGTFEDIAQFAQATFDRRAWFRRFLKNAQFNRATFKGEASFREAEFALGAGFAEAIFEGEVDFDWAEVEGDASFFGATFTQARDLGPLRVLRSMNVDEASFLQPIDIRVSADRLTAMRARFAGGVNLQARWAEIALEQADFSAPSRVAGADEFTVVPGPRHYQAPTGLGSIFARSKRLDETALGERYENDPSRSEEPRLLSLRRTDVGLLVVSNIDLQACRFDGAINLAGLGTERGEVFARTPATYPGFRRQAIAEEHEFRKTRGGPLAGDWLPPECELPPWLGEARQLEAHEIAAIYRDLRKGREDRRDEPGAADFYYGEMEMRRLDKTGSFAERVIVWLYWLFSGYGLRASRAAVALAATVFVFGALLDAWGFPEDVSFGDALTFSAQSTTGLFRPPQRDLTLAGKWLEIGLRLLGPLFFGLALLSLRGRVKR
jgi:Pentapeptide repeats (9 copies)